MKVSENVEKVFFSPSFIDNRVIPGYYDICLANKSHQKRDENYIQYP